MVELQGIVTPPDIAYLARHMRQADIDELAASSGHDPYTGLRESLRNSSDSHMALIDGKPAALFGVAPLSMLAGQGIPWLLGTEAVYTHATQLTRLGRRYFDAVRVMYPTLVNYVDARNRHAVRWLGFMGFEIDDPAPFGVLGLPFHRFEMRA